MQSDNESIDSSDSDTYIPISEEECETVNLSGGWKRVTDIF